MAKLNFSLDGNLLAEYPVDKERITIGRRPSNDIHIDNMAVSGQHAVIITISGDSFLEDLNSTNGTTVNGKAIKKYVLHHQDIIEFGKYQLTYINEAQAPLDTNLGQHLFDKTIMLRPGRAGADVPAAPTANLREGHLKIVTGENAGKELLLNRALITLGKPGEQLAVLTRRPQGYFLSHVEGKSLPLVNGKAISLQAHALNNHDVVEVAGQKMEFYFE